MASSQTRLIIGFLVLYALLILSVRSTCWRDPTSKFFQAARAHAPAYSAHRLQESTDYADSLRVKDRKTPGNGLLPDAGQEQPPPELCVGIPSVKRRGISYLKSTLGSMQHGLAPEERARLRFVVLVAYVDQERHPDYGAQWLDLLTDKIASYDEDPRRLKLAKAMERNLTHPVKSKFDYSVLLEECERTNATYVMVVEDDTLFMDGWLHRTMEALREAMVKSAEQVKGHFMYLRLFYYEGLLGWNSESWPKYLTASMAIISGVFCLLLASRRWLPIARLHITTPVLLLVTFAFTPLLILLFFSAGANCIAPQPTGVNLMAEHACCGQGLVFRRETVADELLPWFHNHTWSLRPTDSFIEDYADMTGGLRWALTPVVMQHIGGRSSHGKNRGRKFGKLVPNRIWNFGFEDYDAGSLANEHLQAFEEARDGA